MLIPDSGVSGHCALSDGLLDREKSKSQLHWDNIYTSLKYKQGDFVTGVFNASCGMQWHYNCHTMCVIDNAWGVCCCWIGVMPLSLILLQVLKPDVIKSPFMLIFIGLLSIYSDENIWLLSFCETAVLWSFKWRHVGISEQLCGEKLHSDRHVTHTPNYLTLNAWNVSLPWGKTGQNVLQENE